MSDTKNDPMTTMLAPTGEKRSLVRQMADVVGMEPKLYFEAVKVAAGCKNASDAHFMVLLASAQTYGLDPLRKMIQLLDVGNGPEVYARVDAYKEFIQRAEAAGKVESRKYEEGWFLDPRQPPDKKMLRRGGKVTAKLRGRDEPVEQIVWFDEWAGKGQWVTRGSHMLSHRAWKEFCRDWLGFFVADEMDAENIRQTTATSRPAEPDQGPIEPVVPIATLKPPGGAERPYVAPEPSGAPVDVVDVPPQPEAAWDPEESRRLDREAGLFEGDGKP